MYVARDSYNQNNRTIGRFAKIHKGSMKRILLCHFACYLRSQNATLPVISLTFFICFILVQHLLWITTIVILPVVVLIIIIIIIILSMEKRIQRER